MGRFVQPAETILKISNGDTLTVRRRLNVGELRERLDRMTHVDPTTGKRSIDPLRVDPAIVVAYLLDWSICDDAGVRIPIRDLPPDQVVLTLNQLEADDFAEIKAAIEAHEAATDAAYAAQKKTTTAGATASSPNSISPDAAAGAMNGSTT